MSLLAATAAVSSAVAPSGAVTAKVPGVPVTHVIEIMIENHSFDNLFGSFAGADGIPANTSLLNPNAYFVSMPNVRPAWAAGNEGDVDGQINNSTVAEQMAMDYQPGPVDRSRVSPVTQDLTDHTVKTKPSPESCPAAPSPRSRRGADSADRSALGCGLRLSGGPGW